MKSIRLIIALAAFQFIAACQTTGNPNEGGLFGWSETKAIARQSELERKLSRVERDTGRNSTAAERRRRMLGE